MSSKLFARILTVLALSLPFAPVVAAEGGVSVVDPYARAVPEVVPNSAAFMTLRNAGDADRKLVAGRTSAAGTVELHTHINDEGVMRMRQVPEIAIPAGGETRLEPGGLHIMLIGLKQPLQPGDTLELELEFDDGSSESLNVPVRKIGMGHMQHHHH
jgi:hypothetical protein